MRNLEADATEPSAAGPGHWNDPDYLGPDLGLTRPQFQTQFSMWSMLAAPLMFSVNLSTLTPREPRDADQPQMIAIDQDKLGRQGVQVPPGRGYERTGLAERRGLDQAARERPLRDRAAQSRQRDD